MSVEQSAVEVRDQPAHVAAWSVARISGFVAGILSRWEREHGTLPAEFSLVLCPQAEVSAMGGLPAEVHELTDPRLRCRHFTGCHRPYVALLFHGTDAESRRAAVQALLPWSEGYQVVVVDGRVTLWFRDANEALEDAAPSPGGARSLRSLVESGELVRILE
ncbi:MAG: hypothetical protein MUF66_06095 [Gammaproteobacteria bacterium]|nr:hypothetical protein [Gammaproteobacteria bacterium]